LFLPVALLVFAACGSSGSKASAPNTSPTTPTSAKTPTSAATSTGAVVRMTNSSKLGALLVDAKGMTLYALTNAGKPVECTGQCATFWPPLLVPSGTMTPKGGAGVTGLGLVAMNGGMQVTEHGDPLYSFSQDKAAGDTNGEGIKSFGGTWHVAKTTAAATAGTPTTTGMTVPATSGGGGYHY
jgi:predicted lipoprotein with Yx(FWY)xxD motif